jgi:lysophospholipase L1-like esterase
MRTFSKIIGVVLLAGWSFSCAMAQPASHNFTKWEKAIGDYERADATNAPPKDCVVFIGSSTVARWKTLAADFPGVPAVNRGFGGSEIIDATHFAPRIVFPYAPKVVVLRAGGNDLWAGNSVEKVFGDFKDFVETVHARLPSAKIVFLSLNPTPSRWTQHEKEKALNALAENYMKDKAFAKYIETYDVPLGAGGLPRAELFVADKLHFNADGYQLFAARIRPLLPKE